MRRVPVLIAFCLLFALTAHSQNTTVVTGTITDANGIPYSGATVYIELAPALPAGTVTGTLPAGFVCCQPETTTTDKNGAFTKLLGSNAAMQAGKQWKFTVTEPGIAAPMGTGAQTFTATITISGASQDVGATLSAAAPNLSNGTGVTSPVIDITDHRYGGKCDDTTADDAALDLALAAVPQTATSNGAVISFPNKACKFTATHASSKNNITFRSMGGWRYVARSVPASFLDYTGTDNFLEITGQGVRFQDINIKAPNVLAAITPPVIAGGGFTKTSSGMGTLATTENFQIIYLNNNFLGSDRGASLVSNEIAVTSIGTNCVTVASPAATGDADNYEVFMGAISGNERRVTGAIAIGTAVQICAAVDLGSRPYVDTSAKAAIYTTSAPVLDNAEIFSGVIAAFGVKGDAFIQSVGSGPLITHSKIEGFSVGVEMGTGSNVFSCCEQSVFQNNGWDLVIGNGGDIVIDDGIWQFTATGHIKLINVSTAHVTNNYFEQNTTTQPFLQLGDTTVPTVSNKTVGPITVDFSNNYGNCASLNWASGGSPIEIQQFNGFTPGSLRIANNTFAACHNQLIIDNAAQIATANITIDGNVQGSTAFHATNCNGGQCGWITNAGSGTGALTGVGPDGNDPVNNTSLVPTIPAFLLGLQGGLIAVASLPVAAAGNKGQMQTVSDSTAVTVEGQTCVGSSTNTALAFSNGSVWKCF